MKFISALGACVLLAACGGTTVPLGQLDDFADFQQDVRAAQSGVMALNRLSRTTAANMPTSGQATFIGRGALSVTQGGLGNGDPAVLMLGQSRITAEFARSTVKGQITDLKGVRPIGNGVVGVTDVGGQVTIGANRSQIGDNTDTAVQELASTWTADFVTDLNFDGQRIRAAGNLDGDFIGNRVNAPGRAPMKAVTATGSNLGTLGTGPAVIEVEVYGNN